MSELRPKISIGTRVGMLTVESKTGKYKGGYTVWLCRCECGGEIELDTRYLQRGTIKDCGCMNAVKPGILDLRGIRFGKLVCIEPTKIRSHNGSVNWLCRCDCGKECIVSTHQLRAGYTKSCGCLSHPPLKDYIGKKFGRLTVLRYAGKKKGMHQWLCSCDCGNQTIAGQTLLQNGKKQSCGCLQVTANERNPLIVEGTNIRVLEYYRRNLSPNNTSGYTGVSKDKRNNLWTAQIGFKGKTYHLGSFQLKEDAAHARRMAEELHEDFLKEFYQNHPNLRNN